MRTIIDQINDYKDDIRKLLEGVKTPRRANNRIYDGWSCVVLWSYDMGCPVTVITPEIEIACSDVDCGSMIVKFTPFYDKEGHRVYVEATAYSK